MEQPATSLGTTTKALPVSPAMPSTSVRSAIPAAPLPEPPTHAVPSGAEKSTEKSPGSHEEGDPHEDQKASTASMPESEPEPSLEQDSSSKDAVLRPKRVVRRSASKRKQSSTSTSAPSAPASKPQEVLTNPYR